MNRRIGAGRAVPHVAAEMGISRTTAWRWRGLLRDEGMAGLVDRSSIAHSPPQPPSPRVETKVRIMRELSHPGPVFIADKLGMQPFTVGGCYVVTGCR